MMADGDKAKADLKAFVSTFNTALNRTVSNVQRNLAALTKKIDAMDSCCSERCVDHASKAYVSMLPPPKVPAKRKTHGQGGKGAKIKKTD